MPADTEVSDDKKLYIQLSDNNNALRVNETECKLKTGCEFEVKASADTDGMLYLKETKFEKKDGLNIA